MPMDDIPSTSENETENDGNPENNDTQPPQPPPQSTNENAGNCCSSCCCFPRNQGISRNKIEPVIFQPINDIYLQLKANRRIRVIHLNGQGALPISTPYYLQTSV